MSTPASDLYQQNAGISAINSGPIVIRTYNDLSGNNTFLLGKYDIPISSNYVLITSADGKLVPSNAIYVSSVIVSSLIAVSSNVSTLNASVITTSTLSASTVTSQFVNFSTAIGSTIRSNTNIVNSTLSVSSLNTTGNVGIGITPLTTLHVNGTITCGSILPLSDSLYNIGGPTPNRFAAVYAANGTIQTSDSSEKDLILLPYGLNEVMQVKTIMYKWKSQALLPDTDPTKNFQYYGICADQLSAIFPELVYNEDPNVPMQLNYSEIIPVVIKAIQEQNDSIQQLYAQTQKINKLELELSSIKNQLDQIITNSK